MEGTHRGSPETADNRQRKRRGIQREITTVESRSTKSTNYNHIYNLNYSYNYNPNSNTTTAQYHHQLLRAGRKKAASGAGPSESGYAKYMTVVCYHRKVIFSMTRIQIDRLRLENFKCHRNLELDFGGQNGVAVPLFVDNAESVTNLEYAATQVIRLVVSESDKKLRCEHES